MLNYIYSNLIMENSFIKESKKHPEAYREEVLDGIKIYTLDVDGTDELCPRGRFVTLETEKMWTMEDGAIQSASGVTAIQLKKTVEHVLGRKIDKDDTFLVAGMGNRRISADALGPMTLDRIDVTRHVDIVAPRVFRQSGLCSVCAVECGVLGDTGIRSYEVLIGLVGSIKPNAIIAVDALASRAVRRLGATVQISDTGISPGAGIGNRQAPLNAKTLGVPVIAIGVPTVIRAATLCADILSKCPQIKPSALIENELEAAGDFFVAPKECDILSRKAAEILAMAVNQALNIL